MTLKLNEPPSVYMYRKPTHEDLIIAYDSNGPQIYKMAAFRTGDNELNCLKQWLKFNNHDWKLFKISIEQTE